jgi:hypothetical protein
MPEDDDCKHWRERDDESGCIEFCSSAQVRCACSGVKRQCNFPRHFEPVPVKEKQG